MINTTPWMSLQAFVIGTMVIFFVIAFVVEILVRISEKKEKELMDDTCGLEGSSLDND